MSGMPIGADENPLDLTPSEIELGEASSTSTPTTLAANLPDPALADVATSASARAPLHERGAPFVSSATLNAIYNCITLGMEPYTSMLLAELTDEQINYLNEDEGFNRRVRFYQQKKERDLLEKLDSVMERNILAGQSTEIRWLLSKLNKKRYGNSPDDDGLNGDLPPMRIGAGG